MSSTTFVRAVMPVLGLRAGQIAELTDSPYLQKVIERGWLEKVSKTEAKEAGSPGEDAPDRDIAVIPEK